MLTSRVVPGALLRQHRNIRRGLGAALASVALVSCGGGGAGAPQLATVEAVNALSRAPHTPPAGGFKQLVAFGDSLSDDGAYTFLASIYYAFKGQDGFSDWPYTLGGQFSVNGDGAAVNWTDQLAQSIGLSLTPNIVGYGFGISPTGGEAYMQSDGNTTAEFSEAVCAFGAAAPGGAVSCTNFAQGGSRVTNPDGLGHEPEPQLHSWALTYPVSRQLANFSQQFGRFSAGQLVTVLAGANDISAAALNVQKAKNDLSPGLTPGQVEAALQPVVLQAQADVGLAADQLAELVRQMLQQGASYVLVYTVPDIGLTPRGQAWEKGSGCNLRDATRDCFLLSDLVQVFNRQLAAGLLGLPVRMVDNFAMFNRIVAQPSAFGLANVTQPWCDPVLPASNSLFCNLGTPNTAIGANDANLGSWLFADDIHPAPRGQQVMRDTSLAALRAFGWI